MAAEVYGQGVLSVGAAALSETGLVLAIIAGFAVIFPLFWCGVVWLLSHMSGWQALARSHGAGTRPVTGVRHSLVTGMVGWVSYRNVLTLHVAADGLFIEVMPLFRIGHPRLFIPWTEIGARRPSRVLFWTAEQFEVGRPPAGVITLPPGYLGDHVPA
ncbi:hypothetical protein [Aestuariivirga sp.]|uniref:hypothetical protein n=1 Tax=Aestuariivirga sp. TaxID=2650926 RepID=UPI003592E8FA